MLRIKSKTIATSLLLSLTFLISSCSTTSSTSNQPTSGGELTTSSSESGFDNSQLVIGMEANYQPFNWTTQEESDYTLPIYGTSGEYADGYDVAVAKYLGEATGKEVVIKRIEWGSLITDLQNGQINMILAGMSDTEERRESIDFTDPYLTSDLAFLVRTEDMPTDYGTQENPATYEQLLDLFDGETLICQSSVVGDDYIETYFTNNTQGKNIRHADPMATYPAAANEVLSGTAFAMPAELPVVQTMTNLASDQLSVLYCDYESFLSEDDLGGLSVSIGIAIGNNELKTELNTALASLSEEERSQMMGAAASRSAANA